MLTAEIINILDRLQANDVTEVGAQAAIQDIIENAEEGGLEITIDDMTVITSERYGERVSGFFLKYIADSDQTHVAEAAKDMVKQARQSGGDLDPVAMDGFGGGGKKETAANDQKAPENKSVEALMQRTNIYAGDLLAILNGISLEGLQQMFGVPSDDDDDLLAGVSEGKRKGGAEASNPLLEVIRRCQTDAPGMLLFVLYNLRKQVIQSINVEGIAEEEKTRLNLIKQQLEKTMINEAFLGLREDQVKPPQLELLHTLQEKHHGFPRDLQGVIGADATEAELAGLTQLRADSLRIQDPVKSAAQILALESIGQIDTSIPALACMYSRADRINAATKEGKAWTEIVVEDDFLTENAAFPAELVENKTCASRCPSKETAVAVGAGTATALATALDVAFGQPFVQLLCSAMEMLGQYVPAVGIFKASTEEGASIDNDRSDIRDFDDTYVEIDDAESKAGDVQNSGSGKDGIRRRRGRSSNFASSTPSERDAEQSKAKSKRKPGSLMRPAKSSKAQMVVTRFSRVLNGLFILAAVAIRYDQRSHQTPAPNVVINIGSSTGDAIGLGVCNSFQPLSMMSGDCNELYRQLWGSGSVNPSPSKSCSLELSNMGPHNVTSYGQDSVFVPFAVDFKGEDCPQGTQVARMTWDVSGSFFVDAPINVEIKNGTGAVNATVTYKGNERLLRGSVGSLTAQAEVIEAGNNSTGNKTNGTGTETKLDSNRVTVELDHKKHPTPPADKCDVTAISGTLDSTYPGGEVAKEIAPVLSSGCKNVAYTCDVEPSNGSTCSVTTAADGKVTLKVIAGPDAEPGDLIVKVFATPQGEAAQLAGTFTVEVEPKPGCDLVVNDLNPAASGCALVGGPVYNCPTKIFAKNSSTTSVTSVRIQGQSAQQGPRVNVITGKTVEANATGECDEFNHRVQIESEAKKIGPEAKKLGIFKFPEDNKGGVSTNEAIKASLN